VGRPTPRASPESAAAWSCWTPPPALRSLVGGRLFRVRLRTQRWSHAESGSTRHGRPTDDVPRVRACSLIGIRLALGESKDRHVHHVLDAIRVALHGDTP
jgi:hypothetical protein